MFRLLVFVCLAIALYFGLRRRLGLEKPAPRRDADRQTKPTGSNAEWDPYAVLGVGHGASRAEITRAYRTQMKRYHPDRVDDLGEELQRVAHEKTLEIQRAYQQLSKG
jgi:DnaJ-class molecular chaperone